MAAKRLLAFPIPLLQMVPCWLHFPRVFLAYEPLPRNPPDVAFAGFLVSSEAPFSEGPVFSSMVRDAI